MAEDTARAKMIDELIEADRFRFTKKEADNNLREWLDVKAKITKASEYSGITLEQGFKFMDVIFDRLKGD